MSRYKRDGRPPIGAVNSVLNEHKPSNITRITVSGTVNWSMSRQLSSIYQYARSAFNPLKTAGSSLSPTSSPDKGNSKGNTDSLRTLATDTIVNLCETVQQPDQLLTDIANRLVTETPIESDVSELLDIMEYVDHHRAHAAGAYFTSGFDESTVVTVDSAGDSRSSTVYHGQRDELTEIASNSNVDSIGMIWSRLPTVFGFKGARHAGKFMGLAAYADEPPSELRKQFRDMVTIDGMDITNHWARTMRGDDYEAHVTDLKDRFGSYSAPQVARALQDRSAEIVTTFIRNAVAETGCGNIALSGGVMANVKLNQHAYELDSVDSVWVQQAMSDSGLCLGSAFHVGCQKYGWLPERLDSMALGPAYDSSQVTRAINAYENDAEFDVTKEIDISGMAATAADHLADGDVVCVYNGRMEFGPRALGQRSILYQPTDPDAIDWLNKRLDRTEFMPFAPVTLREAADECYENYTPERCPAADHMTISLNCSDIMKARSPGVVHVDGTARPQIIDGDDSQLYYEILQHYYERTDIPTLVNTSFNMHGEPLVCTPKQALESWIRSENEVLLLEDRLLTQEGA